MTLFHSLTITDVHSETRDCVVLTLEPGKQDRDKFRFTQGQYLTFRREFDGVELRRNYSICAGVDDGKLRVGIKYVDGGSFSSWANDNIKVGDRLEAMLPRGNFHVPLNENAEKHYLCLAGGSGITPILSIIKTTLAREPNSQITLIYCNSSIQSVMFREELEDIKNENLGRFSVLHILGSGARDIDLFSGRLDEIGRAHV